MNPAQEASPKVSANRDERFDDWVSEVITAANVNRGFHDWARELRELPSRLPKGAKPWLDAVQNILAALSRPHVDVAFVGNQKAGKSTLLNGAMGRTILAVDDLPETGTVCQISAGQHDEAAVEHAGEGSASLERIPCSPQAIRQVTALQPGQKRREEAAIPRRVHLTLRDVSIPPDVNWLDTPGTDDTAEMSARSREAAEAADVLVFVSSSRQFLGEGEAAYLSSLVARNGPASVILVINAFLREVGPSDWDRFCTTMLGTFLNKVREWSPEMGFTEASPLTALPVCAEALAMGDGVLLGGKEFMGTLLGIRSPEHPRVRRTRTHRAAGVLLRLAKNVGKQRTALAVRAGEKDRRNAAAAELAATNRSAFLRQALGLATELITEASEQVRRSGDAVRESVTSQWSDVTAGATVRYDKSLATNAHAELSGCIDAFLLKLRDRARQYNQGRPDDVVGRLVRELLLTHKFNVTGGRDVSEVGKWSELAGAVVAAGLMWWLHIFTGGISLVVSAFVGWKLGASAREKAKNNAASEARDAIRRSIDAETNKAVMVVLGARDALLKLVADACPPEPVPHEPTERELAMVGELRKLGTDIEKLAEWGRQLAGTRASQ